MNEDIEGLEPGLRDVAERIKAAPAARVRPGFCADVMKAVHAERVVDQLGATRRLNAPAVFAAAAALVAFLGVAALFLSPAPRFSTAADFPGIGLADGSRPSSAVAPYVQAYAVRALVSDPTAPHETLSRAVAEIAMAQRADGGWGSPAITVRNVAALAAAVRAGDEAAACAWKRGVRYLRAHGLPETDPFADDASRFEMSPVAGGEGVNMERPGKGARVPNAAGNLEG